MKNRLVIYSALVGDYDQINSIPFNQEIDCVFFTDLPEKYQYEQSGWIFKPVDSRVGKNSKFINRWYKMHPHILFPDYEESIYIDSNIVIHSFENIFHSIEQLKLSNFLIAAPKHPLRNCIYEEAVAVVETLDGLEDEVKKTVNYLRKNNYPAGLGLLENNFIWRQHNSGSIKYLMTQWWSMIKKYSSRDQLSLVFLLWKMNIKAGYFFGDGSCTRDRNDVTYLLHRHLI